LGSDNYDPIIRINCRLIGDPSAGLSVDFSVRILCTS
jgi:hypothetical protein